LLLCLHPTTAAEKLLCYSVFIPLQQQKKYAVTLSSSHYSSRKNTLLLCLHPTAAAKKILCYSVFIPLQQQKNYSVTLSLTTSSHPAANLQQQKTHSVTLSLKTSYSVSFIPSQRSKKSPCGTEVTFKILEGHLQGAKRYRSSLLKGTFYIPVCNWLNFNSLYLRAKTLFSNPAEAALRCTPSGCPTRQ
jgi:hypothetical protein